ncbi:MAG TPA: tetratricopeptide repeat protein [Thermoanaerobaculia bacterium]|jgi:tetratricopeptide (TPR) repeat protein|nr:tetratricopeptide repeat protein [Thermoanaerobaculia bacterium]
MTKKRRSAQRRPAAERGARGEERAARPAEDERRDMRASEHELRHAGGVANAASPMPLARWRWLAMLVPVELLVLALTLGYLWNEDFWWYLSSGEAVLDAGRIPAHDPFLYTPTRGSHWVIHSWLWTVLVALLHRLGGLGLVVIGQALVAAAVVGLVYTAARLDRWGLANACWSTALVLAAGARLCGKAELATWLMLAAFVRLLGCGGAFTWKRGALIGALFVLWANLHGGYPLGLVAVGCYAAAGQLARWRAARGSTRDATDASAAPPLWTLPAFAALALLGPGSWRERLAPLSFVSGAANVQPRGELGTLLIVEWRSPFAVADVWPSVIYLGLLIAGAASFVVCRRRSPARLLLFLALAGLAATAVRHLVPFAVVTALVGIYNLREGRRERRGRRAPKAARTKASDWRYAVAAGALAFALTLSAAALWAGRRGFESGQSSAGSFSFFEMAPRLACPGAASILLAQDLAGPIFNDYQMGGYLGWRLHPARRVFIDPRVLDPQLVVDYTQMVDSPDAWAAAERRYGFRTAVLGLYSKTLRGAIGNALLHDPRWRVVYADALAVVFAKDAPGVAPVFELARAGAASTPPFVVPTGAWSAIVERVQRIFLGEEPGNYLVEYLASLGELGRSEDVVRLTAAALARRPGDPLLLRQRGAAKLVLGDLAGSLADCGAAYERKPDDPMIVALYALVLDRSGRAGEARALVDRALERSPGDERLQDLRRQLGAH